MTERPKNGLKDACISSEGGGNREHLSSAKAAAAPGPEKDAAMTESPDRETVS